MRGSLSRARLLLITGAVAAGVTLATACAQIIGADFDVQPGTGGGPPDGGLVTVANGSSSSSGGSGGGGGGGGSGGGNPDCVVGKCKVEIIAANEELPWGITAQGSWVYWTSGGAGADGHIKRVSRDAPASAPNVQILVSNLDMPNQIVADDAFVYWTSTRPAPDGAVYRLALSDTRALPEPMSTGESSPTGIAVDGVFLYWLSADGHLRRRPVAALASDLMTPTTTFSTTITTPGLVVVGPGGATAFVTDFSPVGGVWSLALDGSDSGLEIVTGQVSPLGLVLHQGQVCFTSYTKLGKVRCSPMSSNGNVTTVGDLQDLPASITSDGSALYWVDEGSKPNTGAVMMFDGVNAFPLATEQPYPNGIAVAGDYVYWTNRETALKGGSVARVRIH